MFGENSPLTPRQERYPPAVVIALCRREVLQTIERTNNISRHRVHPIHPNRRPSPTSSPHITGIPSPLKLPSEASPSIDIRGPGFLKHLFAALLLSSHTESLVSVETPRHSSSSSTRHTPTPERRRISRATRWLSYKDPFSPPPETQPSSDPASRRNPYH